MGLFEDFSGFSLITDAVEFNRYYEFHTDDVGTEYLVEVSERTFEKQYGAEYEVLWHPNYNGNDYVFLQDKDNGSNDGISLIISRFEIDKKGRVALYEVDENMMRRLVNLYEQL